MRRIDPTTLQRELRGDIDWIIMKAMDKDRNRRYETANGLALDIQRHLNDEPILARSPSTTYRLSKFVRRNRVGVTAGASTPEFLVDQVVEHLLEAGGGEASVQSLQAVAENVTFKLPPEVRIQSEPA